VSFARNRCLQEASGRWVAFLDDDERAPELWLASLLDAARVYGADAVFGPVLPLYEGEPADWLIKDQPHERTRFATGTPIGWKDTHTGNVLMKRSVIEMVGGFDARFAQTGGEDCFFFACALKCGARLVWSDDATIWEVIPQQRMTRRWVIQRAFHGGRTYVRVQAALQGRRAYVKWFAHGLGMFLVLAGPAALMWMLRRHGWLFYVTKLASAAGKLVAVGYSSGPYG
jgi:succinoglycan biosynthesis protein ExoM